MNKKGNILINVMISIILLGLLIIGLYIYKNRDREVVYKNLNGGKIDFLYYNDKQGIAMNSINSMSDEDAFKLSEGNNVFNFAIQTDFKGADRKEITYNILYKLKDKSNNKNIKISLEKLEDGAYRQVVKPITLDKVKNLVLYSSKVSDDVKQEYRVKVWKNEGTVTNFSNDEVLKFTIQAKDV